MRSTLKNSFEIHNDLWFQLTICKYHVDEYDALSEAELRNNYDIAPKDVWEDIT